jgi:ABC-type bacteriocin/lantibiotic exporter with double-glycine peptidase domain
MLLKTNLKLFSVLERKQKIRIGYFGFFLIVIMFLETFSFGMFYPFLQSITNNSLNADFASLLNYFKNILNINLSIELTALLIFTSSIIIKNLFLFFFEFWSLTLLRDLRLNFKSKILKNHFQDDYEKISNIKTSVYIRDFNGTVDTFIRSLQSTMLLIIEFGVFLGLVGLLIFIQSKETIFFVLVLGFIGILFALMVNNILKKYGEQNLYLQERSMNKLLDILNSTKEIIMSKKSPIFTKQFIKFQFNDLTIKRSVNLIQKFPKIFFEIVVVVGFTLYIFFLSFNGDDLSKIIPEVGIFFLAIIRILPAVSKIILHANKLKHAEVAAVKISDDIKNYNKLFSNKKSLSEIEFKDHLKLKKISFNYRNRDKKILEEVDFSINKNDYIGITGESGGGKSTLIDIISGLLIPNSGVITIDGKETKNLQSTNWIDKVGYLTQKNNLLDESIFTNITLEFNKDNIDKKLINEVFDKTGLRELINSLPEGIDTLIGENGFGLSGGERQRIGIARLLYAKKEILIFDESTSNLDHKNKEKFIKTINQLAKEKTIIIISHDESVIKNCKIKYIVKEKKLIKIN